MSESRSGGSTFPILGFLAVCLGVLFIGLKLTGHIDWDWVWVLAPLWSWLGCVCVVLFLALGLVIVAAVVSAADR